MLKVVLIVFIALTAILASLTFNVTRVRPTSPLKPSSAPLSPSPASPSPVTCKVAGCSSQLCVSRSSPDLITTCEWRDEYACLKKSRCELQPNQTCGWTATPEYLSCLKGQ